MLGRLVFRQSAVPIRPCLTAERQYTKKLMPYLQRYTIKTSYKMPYNKMRREARAIEFGTRNWLFRGHAKRHPSVRTNRFQPTFPSDLAAVRPLNVSEEDGELLPVARSPWQDDVTRLFALMKRTKPVRNITIRRKFRKLKIVVTGHDKLILEETVAMIRRLANALYGEKMAQKMLGLPSTSSTWHVIKFHPGPKHEQEVVSYQLDIYRRMTTLTQFPAMYFDILMMQVRKSLPAGVSLRTESVVDGDVSNQHATKEMRESAQKMAKRAVKGKKATVRVM